MFDELTNSEEEKRVPLLIYKSLAKGKAREKKQVQGQQRIAPTVPVCTRE